jgi:hypothetical protein
MNAAGSANTPLYAVFGSVPLVWTRASQGVLQGQWGMQDVTIGGKYAVILAVIVVATVAVFTALSGGISGALNTVNGIL